MSGALGTATVMGAGAWGTAVAKVLADAGSDVRLWVRRPEVADEINTSHTNNSYLPGVVLPSAIRATADPAEALDGVSTVVLGVPSQTMRANLESWRGDISDGATLVSLAKGIELDTCLRMSQVIVAVTGVDRGQVAVVSGPNLAAEVAERQPAATVVACIDPGRAATLQQAFDTGYLRPYTNADVVGCEVGGVVKNVIAIAAGMAEGMGFGDNSRATLITRGLAEMTRLGVAMGGQPATFAGLAGMGDLIATCSSKQSRNNMVGFQLGEGKLISEVLASMTMVAEGVKSSPSVLDLARRHDVEMPITEQMVAVCHQGRPAREALAALMQRSRKSEME